MNFIVTVFVALAGPHSGPYIYVSVHASAAGNDQNRIPDERPH